jgi:hypothetical protein
MGRPHGVKSEDGEAHDEVSRGGKRNVEIRWSIRDVSENWNLCQINSRRTSTLSVWGIETSTYLRNPTTGQIHTSQLCKSDGYNPMTP